MKHLNTLLARIGPAAVLFAILAASLSTVHGAAPATGDAALQPLDPAGGRRVPGYVLARIPDPAAASPAGYRAERIFGDWYKLYPGGLDAAESVDLDTLLAAAEALPGVAAVEPDIYVSLDGMRVAALAAQLSLTPNDAFYDLQWHMPQVQLEQAWGATTGAVGATGQGVIIAILDSGVSADGEDGFCNGLFAEFNVFTKEAGPGAAHDDNGHGTHVAGTAAGCGDNGVGVVGVAPAARLMAVKVLDDDGIGTFAGVAAGIVWAAGLEVEDAPLNPTPAQVINLSLGDKCSGATYPVCSNAMVNDAIADAVDQDVVIVASAGNNNQMVLGMPGNHPEVIGVGATRYDRGRANYSNRGVAMGLAAPGGQFGQDLNNDGYVDGVMQETYYPGEADSWGYYFWQGTSMASPHVAGAAALLRACVPEADRDDVRDALQQSAEDLGDPGFDPVYGHGFLQIYDALAALAADFGRDPQNGCAPTGQPPPCFPASAAAAGPGVVTLAPPPNCDPDGAAPFTLTQYSYGTELTLTAAADDGSQFDGWDGALRGMTTPISLRVTRPLTIVGEFSTPPLEPQVFLSYKGNVKRGGVTYADEDVLLDDPDNGLSLWFDGSANRLGKGDVDAVALLPDGTVLLSPDGNVKKLPGMGNATVDDSDIVRYHPATGLYSWYFDGSDMELTTAAEDIDGLAVLPDGRLLISTVGAYKTAWVSGGGDDILVYEGPLGSDKTVGTLELYFDSSDLAPKLKKIGGVAYSPAPPGLGTLYLVSDTNVTIGGLAVTKGDVFRCEIETRGADSSCRSLDILWRGGDNGIPAKAALDAVDVVFP